MNRRTRTLVVSPDAPDPDSIDEAAAILRRGGLVAFATETVYGLGADATSRRAVSDLYRAKGRPSTNPLIVHVDSVESARPLAASWSPVAESLAERFWPGPLTIVVPRTHTIVDEVTGGGQTVGLRVPRPKAARDLIARSGRPIAAPSANRSLRISPTLARHVAKDLDGRIDLILDSGPTTVGLESTVLDLTTDPPAILRPGRIGPDELATILGITPRIGRPGSTPDAVKSPGLADVHYAPQTPTFRVGLDDLPGYPDPGRAGLLLIGLPTPASGQRFGHRVELLSPDFAEPAFYGSLHRLDEMGLDAILVVGPPPDATWTALEDRLRRAARPLPIAGPRNGSTHSNSFL